MDILLLITTLSLAITKNFPPFPPAFSISPTYLSSNIAPKKIAQQITVRIDGESSHGSGVIINSNRNSFYVLTNAHVVSKPSRYQIVTFDGVRHQVKRLKIISGLDVALLWFTSDRNYQVATIKNSPITTGEKVYVSGWPRSGGTLRQPIFVTTEGNLTETESPLSLGYSLSYTNLVRAGMSGGAILDAEGKLIGINGIVRLPNNSVSVVASGIPLNSNLQSIIEKSELIISATPNQSNPNSIPTNSGELNQPSPSSYTIAKTFTPETSEVKSLAFNPINQTIISGNSDGTISIWHRDKGLLSSYPIHNSSVNAIAISPDGKFLVSGDESGAIEIFDLINAQSLRSLQGHQAEITSLAFSPDGKTIISSSWDKTIRIWKKYTGQLVNTLTGHSALINAIAPSPDGKILATGSQDKTIRLWDLSTGKSIGVLTGHSLSILSLAISPDAKTLASGSGDGTIKIWSLDSKELINTLQGHTDGIWSLAIAGDNQTLFSSSWDRTIKVWDLNTAKVQETISGNHDAVFFLNS